MQKIKPKKKQPFNLDPYKEVLALICLSLGVYLGLSLWSYHPADPSFRSFFSDSSSTVHNMGGVVGGFISDLLIQMLGYAGYVCVAFFLWASSYFAFFKQSFRYGWVAGWMLLLVCSSIGLAIFDQGLQIVSWGGWVGLTLKAFFQTYTGTFGMGLFVISGLLIALGLIFQLKIKHFTQSFQFLIINLRKGFHKTAMGFAETFTKLKTWFLQKMKKEEQGIEKTLQEISESKNVVPIRLQSKNSKKEDTTRRPPIVIAKKSEPETEQDLPERSQEVQGKEQPSDFRLPRYDLLDNHEQSELTIDKEALLENASILENKLKDFGVLGKVVEVQPGPVVTMYEFEPAAGVKVNKITSLGDDLTLALKALSVRIALIPGKSVVGIEVANPQRQVVYIKDIIENRVFENSKSKLTLTLGKDISGTPVVSDLRKMPHLLVAGATGSGKSVSINSMLVSVLCKATPNDVRMILVDPKMLELSLYDKIPHLLLPVVTDPRKASAALKWAVREMEKRYRLMAELGVRNIEGYNSKVDAYMKKNPRASYEENMQEKPKTHEGPMPLIMIVIDELADLMMVASKDVEDSIIRLAQMARASGIHLLLATQRPSVDVITGVIKANMPSRISFQVSSKTDSRTILDANGAEQLLGAGDMLYMPPGTSKIQRLHGSFISDDEVARITDFWKEQADPQYNEEILQSTTEQDSGGLDSGDPEEDELYRQAIEIAKERGVASISYIQRRLRIGYNRSARLVERMEEDGFLAPGEVGKPREVLTHQMP